jgi:hypothetical protein
MALSLAAGISNAAAGGWRGGGSNGVKAAAAA